MAENYIQDPELLKQLNEGYVTDPKILEALNATTPVEQAFSEPKSWLTSPTIPQDFSAQRVGESVALGTGIGAALGAPTGVGIIPGAIGGAASGLVAGVTGEFARQAGAPESVILASEITGGSILKLQRTLLLKVCLQCQVEVKLLLHSLRLHKLNNKLTANYELLCSVNLLLLLIIQERIV